MHGGRLSAAEKGKHKVADADLALAALVLESAGEPRPVGDDAAANWHAGGSALPHHLLVQLPPSGTSSEIEEAPPSPPPAPSRPHLPALDLDAEDAAAAVVAGLEGWVKAMQAALDSRLRELEQLRRERESKRSKLGDVGKWRRDGGDMEMQMLQHKLGSMQERVSGIKDTMLARRYQEEQMLALEEFWKPVVPGSRPNPNNTKLKAEEMQAFLEEFWKPVPVPQRNNSKINWKRIIISLIAITSGLVPSISLWTLLSVNNRTHIVGAISVLWILRSANSCCQRFRTSGTISRHVPRLIYVCFWLLVLYVVYLYLILRPIHGAFAGLLGRHQ